MKNTQFKNRLRAGTALAVICAAGLIAPTPAYADCTLSGDGLTLTCTGDLSGGDLTASDTVTSIVFTGVTTDIGGSGILLNGTGTADITFDTTAEPINIVLSPPATIPGITNRAGFNILTGGRIDGILVGDVSGAIEADQTVDPSVFNMFPYGAIGLEAGTGINFTHTGDINVSRGDLRREDTSRADFTNGRFAGLRTESDAGDVVVTNTGMITVQGGVLTTETINTTGGSAGARSGQFSNGFSEVIGFMAQGFEALEYTQTGDITINGGGVNVIATTEDNTADAQGGAMETIGIYVPAFNSIDGVFTDGLPRFQMVDIIMNGDITVTGGPSTVSATATGTNAGSSVMAIADGNDFRFDGDAGGVSVTGDDVDVEINGAINVTGGDMSATAIATPGDSGDGLVFVNSNGQDAGGVVANSTGANRLVVSGPINITGGNAFGEATGTGPATTGTLYDDVFDFERTNGLQVRGGSAGGGGYFVGSGGAADLTLGQPITAQGGDAHGIANGGNYGASVFAGGANGFGIGFLTDDAASYTFNTFVSARGGDTLFEANGTNITGFIGGGSAGGVSVSAGGSDFDVGGDITFVQSSDIEVMGGDIVYDVAAGNSEITARGGSALGLELSLIGGNTENLVVIDGIIRATGGNVTGAGDIDTATGGFATGIFSFTGNGANTTIDLNGDVFATAGQGEDGRGSAIGARLFGPNTINVSGTLNVDSANADNSDDPLISTGFGIFGFDDSSEFRDTPGINVSINGGQVNVDAQRGIGIFTASETVDISIINGGTLNVTGQDTTGIIVNGLPFAGDPFTSATANIFVGVGSSINSENGLAIHDFGVAQSSSRGMVNTQDTLNQTAVENAGTITGSGTAIDLDSGSDTLLNRATGVINGDVLMGDGADAVTLETGSVINGDLDLGGGDDTISVSDDTAVSGTISLGEGDDIVVLDELSNDVPLSGGAGNDGALFTTAATDDLTFDLGNFTFSEFETFIQDGMGILTLTGNSGSIFNTYELRGGTLLVETDETSGIAANVSMGGTLGGSGSIGDVRIASGGILAPGSSIGTLNVNSLFLEDGAILHFELGAPGIIGGMENDLVEVAGDLTLDGTLDIFAQPEFGDGVYRLFNYGGTLTDNGLDVGMAPTGDYEVQTSIGGRINLLVGNIANLEFWDPTGAGDGAISGGSGVWNTPSTNWTNADGSVNGDFNNTMAIFMGDAGTVTVEGTQSITALQVAADGYIFEAGTDGAISLDAAETFVRIDPGATATFDVPLVGDGRLIKRDTGTLVLTGTNTHAGGTEVREGVIEISSDDNLGAAGAAFIFNGGTLRTANALTLARDIFVDMLGGVFDDLGNDLTLSGSLSGNGELTKSGTGAWTMRGDNSAFMGQFRLTEGSLQLDGSLGGLLDVQSGTTLSGVGNAGTLDISGTLAVGNSIGTMTASGDVTFRAGSDFQVELAADGSNDFLNVGGMATIEGGTLSIFTLDPETSYSDGQAYNVLSAAGGLNGQFDDLVENSVFLDFNTDYQANDLVVTIEEVLTFPEVAATFNQTQVSNTLMDLGQTAGSDSLAVYNALLMLDGDGARNAFDQSTGEIYAGVVAAGQRQARAHSDKLAGTAWRNGPDGLGAWGALSTQDGKVELDGNGADLEHDRQAIDLGIDYRGPDNTWLIGASAGWSNGDVTLAARDASADADTWQIGAYGRVGSGREGLSAGAAVNFGKGNADVTRNINVPGITRTAQGSTDTDTTALAAEARYGKKIGDGNWVVGPVASVTYAKTDLDNFNETGAEALNLSGTADSKASLYGLGAFANWQGDMGIIDASLQYGHGSMGRAQASLILDGASSQPFLVRAAEHENDRAILKVRGAMDLGNDWSLAADARAEWAAKDTSISVGLTARKTF